MTYIEEETFMGDSDIVDKMVNWARYNIAALAKFQCLDDEIRNCDKRFSEWYGAAYNLDERTAYDELIGTECFKREHILHLLDTLIDQHGVGDLSNSLEYGEDYIRYLEQYPNDVPELLLV